MKAHIHSSLKLLAFLRLFGIFGETVSAAPPRIDYQPKDAAVILNQPAAFGVIASGTKPISYQWRKDGAPIAGATNDQIVFPQPQFGDTGGYSVVVSNSEGSVTSTVAVLTVRPPGAGDVDCSFAQGGFLGGAYAFIQSVAVQPNGKILVAGDVRGGLGRLNADGSRDHTFNGFSGVFGSVHTVALQTDGKVFIAGEFHEVNGVSRYRIARLNTDGSLDEGFRYDNAGSYRDVRVISVQNDGKVLVGGYFSTVNGVNRTNIARLNPDATLDSGFLNGLDDVSSTGFAPYVDAIAIQSDGKLLIGGRFSSVNGVNRTNIARLNPDGSLDAAFNSTLAGAFETRVRSIVIQSDGRILITTGFPPGDCYGCVGNLMRLNPDGSLDSTFQPAIAGDSIVAVGSDGKLLTVSVATDVGGAMQRQLVRLTTDGALDRTFDPVIIEGFGWEGVHVASVIPQSDGKVLIAGSFTKVNGVTRNQVAWLKPDGTLESGFQAESLGSKGHVDSVAVQGDGKVLVGSFTSNVAGAASNIIRINPDGSLDTGFLNVLTLGGFNGATQPGYVQRIALQSDGKVLIGGRFSTVNGVSRTNVARLNPDGTLDSGFVRGHDAQISGRPEEVFALAEQHDGKVLLSVGLPSEFWRSPESLFVRLHPDGSLDTGFPQMNFDNSFHRILSIAVQSDGKVIIGGRFNSILGQNHNCIARLNADGTIDAGFQNGMAGVETGYAEPYITSVVLQPDGKVLIGGMFDIVNGAERIITNVARLNPDGSLDRSFLSPLSVTEQLVLAIAVDEEGRIIIGGWFGYFIDDSWRPYLARLNPDGSLDTTFMNGQPGPNGAVHSIAVASDGNILIGGEFSEVNGVPASGFARLWSSADIAPRFRNIAWTAAGVHLTWDALPDRSYRVEYSDSFSGWTNIPGDVVGPANGIATLTDATANESARRFYRVVLLP